MQPAKDLIPVDSHDITERKCPMDCHRPERQPRIVIELVLTIDIPIDNFDASRIRGHIDLRASRIEL